jgi:uncharacterized membrane protein
MGLLARFNRGEMRLGRIEAFSDGVFGVAATLLVLDLKGLPVSEHPSVAELGHALVAELPRFVSWLISFIIVCKFWLNHHHILSLARHANYAMVWLNSIFLMFVSLVPFPTALMGEHPDNPLAVTLFGAVMALNTLLFIALHAYIVKNLIKPELADTVPPNIIRNSFAGIACYLIGAGASWFSVHAAFVLYFLTPLLFITPTVVQRAGSSALPPEPETD